ncbi:TonB-dependent siderophore receptor [Burkholderia sp. Ax-1724]|uniref:TonB-dependent receptor n=1 Tax=Burkholderia sp. Ax-1724 TaxID=2608336 RepID=UPI001421A032|nr:TonB-dependent siderophore receptor [Burkholderia sp. Ax-1724]NIF53832.1 TonB-dependent siderophore receptor [Burkholderia sp. Ax-1724]
MLTKTPLAIAVMGLFCAPIATSAFAQTNTAAPAAASSPVASSSAAAPADSASSQPQTLPTVQVTGHAESTGFQTDRTNITGVSTDVHDIPQAVTVVNQQLMQSQGVTSFSDALRNVPGVTIGAAEGGVIGNNINLRGFTANNDIYLDGFRDRGQYYRDTFDLESIDVLYGPSSLYFGRGSTGGVINQVTKQANLTKSASVSTTIGTDDHYRTSVDFNQPLTDTSAFRINAFGQSLHGTRDVMSSKDYGIAPTVSFGIGTPNEFTLSALIQHNRDMADYGVQSVNGAPAPVGRSTFYGFTDDRTLQDNQTVTGRYIHRFENGFVLRNQAQLSHTDTDARETSLKRGLFTGPFANSPALGAGNFTDLPLSSLYVGLVSRDRVIDNHSIYNSTDIEGTLGSGWIKHKVVAGIDLGHETYTNQGYRVTGPGMPKGSGTIAIVPLLDPPYNPRPAGSVQTLDNLAESSANSFGAYVNDTISLGEHWKVVGGVRWDRFQASIANTTTAPAYASQTNYFTSVRTGLIYQPTDWQSYYFSYGTSFDPSLEALTLTSGTQNLAPEHSKSYEIGSKWDLLDGNLSISQSLFQIEQSNTRTQNGDGTYTLDGDTRVRGYQIGATGRLGSKWQIYGGYTYLDSEIVKALDGTQGNTLPNTPRHMATLWVTYQPVEHWEIGGGPIYMSSRYPATDNVVKVPSYVRVDAMAAYHTKRYDVQLNLLNLTNKLYYDQLIASDGGRSVPGIGRTLLATFNYRFY